MKPYFLNSRRAVEKPIILMVIRPPVDTIAKNSVPGENYNLTISLKPENVFNRTGYC